MKRCRLFDLKEKICIIPGTFVNDPVQAAFTKVFLLSFVDKRVGGHAFEYPHFNEILHLKSQKQ